MEHAADAPAWLTAIQLSAPAAALRGGIWLYPLVETAHILGFAALFGGILGFDLRLIGFGRALPLDRMARLLLPVAAGGLAVALTTGALLFSVEATAYARNPAFLTKMALLALALVNIAAFHRAGRIGAGRDGTAAARLAGAASLLLWAGVLICGRLIAYV